MAVDLESVPGDVICEITDTEAPESGVAITSKATFGDPCEVRRIGSEGEGTEDSQSVFSLSTSSVVEVSVRA